MESRTRQMEVVEPPPMHGLPPVAGVVNVTVNRVEDPKLPPLPEPLAASEPTDPAVLAALEELRENYLRTELLFVSATVYDHSRTLVQIYPNGGAEERVEAWSNMDFTHFGGFSTYRATGADGSFVDYGLLMGIGHMDTEVLKTMAERYGADFPGPPVPDIPVIADLSVAGPLFSVVEGNPNGKGATILRQMHELYRKEGLRMKAAYIERERVRKEREAHYRANPPEPKDVTINFWRTKRKEGDQ